MHTTDYGVQTQAVSRIICLFLFHRCCFFAIFQHFMHDCSTLLQINKLFFHLFRMFFVQIFKSIYICDNQLLRLDQNNHRVQLCQFGWLVGYCAHVCIRLLLSLQWAKDAVSHPTETDGYRQVLSSIIPSSGCIRTYTHRMGKEAESNFSQK